MNRLKVKYTELVNVSVKQMFYENNICGKFIIEPTPDMIFIPSAETKLLMKRLNFIFKSSSQTGGFTILAETDNKSIPPNYLLRFFSKKGEKLTFFMLLNNPGLLNFNELPIPGDANKIFYFNNKISSNPAPRNAPLYLTQLAGGVDEVKDRIKKSGSMYSYHHSAAVTNAKLKHLLTDIELLPYSLKNLGVGGCDLVFNLKDMPIGKVKLIIDGSDIETFYYAGDNAPASVFGVIELNLSDALDQNYRLIEFDHSLMLPAPLYYIEFKNRETTWRYTFKLTPTSPLYIEINKLPDQTAKDSFMTDLKIVCNDNSITFSQSAPDANTIFFESDNPLALEEKYTIPVTHDRLKLSLTKYTGVPLKEATVIENLPYPPTSMIDARNPAFIYSDIFLTI